MFIGSVVIALLSFLVLTSCIFPLIAYHSILMCNFYYKWKQICFHIASFGGLFLPFFVVPSGMWDFNSSTRDWTHAPRNWKCGVLTAGLPGKCPYSQLYLFYKLYNVCPLLVFLFYPRLWYMKCLPYALSFMLQMFLSQLIFLLILCSYFFMHKLWIKSFSILKIVCYHCCPKLIPNIH